MSSAWRRRNLAWLVALVPLLGLAVLTGSQRMLTMYLPWQLSNPIEARGNRAVLHQEIDRDDLAYTRDVTVQLITVVPIGQAYEDTTAAPGAVLWRADLAFTAASDQILEPCHAQLLSDDVAYGRDRGRHEEYGGVYFTANEKCVPEDTPGPVKDPFDKVITETTPPRPSSWESSLVFALPEGVTPDGLRIWWDYPTYLYFPL